MGRVQRERATALGQAVAAARVQQRLSITELGRLAHVSPNTIAGLEKPVAAGRRRRMRFDVTVRLAAALGENPEVWLRLAGYREIPPDRVSAALEEARALRSSAAIRSRPEGVAPLEFLDGLGVQLKESGRPILMAMCILAKPSLRHELPVLDALTDLIQHGLWLALCCPYPPSADITTSTRANLDSLYAAVYQEAALTVRAIQGRCRKRERQVCLFIPKEPPRLIVPPADATECRPTLIRYGRLDPNDPRDYALCAWVRPAPGQPESVVRVYADNIPGLATPDRVRVVATWLDYLQDILAAWVPATSTGWDNGQLNEWTNLFSES